jgi:tetratricopeptide (TPR) repeat protein
MRVADGLRLANALATYWETNGLYQEGYDWFRRGLAIPLENDEHTRAIRARAYLLAGIAGDRLISRLMQQQLYSESVALYRQCDDRFGLALALIKYGWILSDTMPRDPHPVDYASGIALTEEAIAILEELGGGPTAFANIFGAKVNIAVRQRDFDTSRRMCQQSIAFFEQSGDFFRSERLKYTEAVLAIDSRDFITARRLLEHHLEFGRKINRKNIMVLSIQWLGYTAYLQEDYAQSEIYFQQALVINKELGILEGVVWIKRLLGCINFHLGYIPKARQFFLESQFMGRKLSTGDKRGNPGGDLSFVIWMGVLAASIGRPLLSARFLGAVEAILETFFKPLDDQDKREYDLLVGKLRSTLDAATFTSAWAEGRKLSLEEVLEEALVFCREEE